MKKNAFLSFCFACVPGCGQMYQGYMKRGVSILFWFIAVIGVSVLLSVLPVAMLAIVIWAYSFFDTFNIRNLTAEQQAVFYDDYIPSKRWMEENHLQGIAGKNGRGRKYVAWGLIIIGIVTLYNNFFQSIIWNLSNTFPFLRTVYYNLPRLLIALFVIVLGIYMLRGTNKRAQPPEEDVQHYIGDGRDDI